MKISVLILFFLPFIGTAQTNPKDSLFIHRLAVNILSSDASYHNLHTLTKNIRGRLAGSPQMVMAETWGAKALTAAGADSVRMQECLVPHWVRGGKDKALVTYKNAQGKPQTYELSVLALGNSVGGGTKGIQAPLMRVNDFDELEKRKEEIRGNIVFYNNPFDDTLLNPFEAYRKNVVYRGIGASRAAKYGAVAVLIRSMTNTPGNYPHTGALHYLDSIPQIPAAAMGLDDVKQLNALFDTKQSLTASLFTYGKMLPDTIGHNVIGILTGSEHPEQIITVGGHLDSWDPAKAPTTTAPAWCKPSKCCGLIQHWVIHQNTPSVSSCLPTKKMVRAARSNMQQKQSKKASSTSLRWKVMTVVLRRVVSGSR